MKDSLIEIWTNIKLTIYGCMNILVIGAENGARYMVYTSYWKNHTIKKEEAKIWGLLLLGSSLCGIHMPGVS